MKSGPNPEIERGLVHITGVTRLEVGFSAEDAERDGSFT